MTSVAANAEDVHYVGEAFYRDIQLSTAELLRRTSPSDAEASRDVNPFLLQEARLLDNREYRAWIDLFDEQCIYWVPAHPLGGDPTAQVAINFDDRRRLIDRVTLIETGYLHTQLPSTRTCRVIGNIEAWRRGAGVIESISNLVLWTYRRGTVGNFVGRQLHILVENHGSWRIKSKVILLLDCDEPQFDVTFIL